MLNPRGLFACLGTSLLGAALVSGPPALARTNAEKAQEHAAKDRQTLGAAFRAFEQQDCTSVIKLLDRRLGSKPPVEPAELAAAGFEMLAECHAASENFRKAAETAVAGTRLSESSDGMWVQRLFYQLRGEDYGAAVATIEAMTNGRGKALNLVPVHNLYLLDRILTDGKRDAERRRLLAVLAAPSYAPAETLADADGFRARYARLLIDDGKTDEAAVVVGDIESSNLLTQFALDPRFKALVPADFDERATLEDELARAVVASKLHDELLEPLLMVNRSLRSLGRPEEGLAILEQARERDGGLEGHEDAGEQLNWWWDALGRTYARLGRYDEMVRAFDSGARADEDGGANVSQVINLAWAQIDFGHADAALETIDGFAIAERPMSNYGVMQMRFTRGCALVQAGRQAQAQADIAFMRAHEKDDPYALAEMLLCSGDLDGAAQIYIGQLADPEKRGPALLRLSEFDEPLPTEPKGPVTAAFQDLRARADVQAAAAQAGGTRRIHLQRSEVW